MKSRYTISSCCFGRRRYNSLVMWVWTDECDNHNDVIIVSFRVLTLSEEWSYSPELDWICTMTKHAYIGKTKILDVRKSLGCRPHFRKSSSLLLVWDTLGKCTRQFRSVHSCSDHSSISMGVLVRPHCKKYWNQEMMMAEHEHIWVLLNNSMKTNNDCST